MSNAVIRTVAGLALAGAAAPSLAQFQQNNYSVLHQFSYQPSGDVVEVTAFQFEHAWLRINTVDDEDHTPPGQNPGFDDFGTESFGTNGAVFNSGLFGSAVPVVFGFGVVPSAGVPNVSHCTNAVVGAALATACTRFDIAPFNVAPNPTLVVGEIESAGGVTITFPGRGAGLGYAFSSAAITVQGGNLTSTGSIVWNPTFIIDMVGGGTSAAVVQDPIHFEVTDLINGVVSDYELLSIDATGEGGGTAQWNAGAIDVDMPEFELLASIPSGLVAPGQGGDLYMLVENGVVTQSAATGVFLGSAPPLGLSVPFSVPAPPLDLDFDLGLDLTGNYDIVTTLSGGGDASAALNTCPADLNGDGILDNGDIQLFLELFLGGNIAADLNGDGILDNGDIQLFLELFLGGCSGPDG